ncbi:hypothetical protein GPECTOR_7g1016 [Gonium pectorale]|uniref:Uncharacterized protein n=1 Tax=Gonium pectorale TaxID=33097 RepID=A0A150GTD9_GONPE|nr:hypothetical protein GPECTOR_7g1016 [Gonium pectorale]|eukprot:KXZ53125.1 hypothetical protein GPECTOR_7g1016 [Gonium pectorale]
MATVSASGMGDSQVRGAMQQEQQLLQLLQQAEQHPQQYGHQPYGHEPPPGEHQAYGPPPYAAPLQAPPDPVAQQRAVERQVAEMLEGDRKAEAFSTIGSLLLDLSNRREPPPPGVLCAGWVDPPDGQSIFFVSRGYPEGSRVNAGGPTSGPKPTQIGSGVYLTVRYGKRCCKCNKTYTYSKRGKPGPTCQSEGHSYWPFDILGLAHQQDPGPSGSHELKPFRGNLRLYVAKGLGHVGFYVKPAVTPGDGPADGGDGDDGGDGGHGAGGDGGGGGGGGADSPRQQERGGMAGAGRDSPEQDPQPRPGAKHQRVEPAWEAARDELFSFLEACARFGSADPPATHRDGATLLEAWGNLLKRVGRDPLTTMRLPNGQGLAHWLATPPTHLRDEASPAPPPPTDPDSPLPQALAVGMMQAAVDFLGLRRWQRLCEVQDCLSKATAVHRACRFGHRERVLELVLGKATRLSLVRVSKQLWLPYHTAFRSGHAFAGRAHLAALLRVARELDAPPASVRPPGATGDGTDAAAAPSAAEAPAPVVPAAAVDCIAAAGGGELGAAASAAGTATATDDANAAARCHSDTDSGGGAATATDAVTELLYTLPNKYFQGRKDGVPLPDVSPPYGHELLLEACKELGLGVPAPLPKDDEWELVAKAKALQQLCARAEKLDRRDPRVGGASGDPA